MRVIDTTTRIQKDVPLAPFTTIRLGGKADFFVECAQVDELHGALEYAVKHDLPVHILGGGSNSIFSDEGWRGLVIHVLLQGIEFVPDGKDVVVRAAAGEGWDKLVRQCVEKGLAGIETLSGIPGLVGATPMQNVGAYGQEAADSIEKVRAIDLKTFELAEFSNKECRLQYRGSRFKYEDKGRFVITEVWYRLRPGGAATVTYPQVRALVDAEADLQTVRETVLHLRRQKSMVLDGRDPNTRSCGSFFVNPVVTYEVLKSIQERRGVVPYFEGEESAAATAAAEWTGAGVKIPAAWLIEAAGFKKGERRGGVGISQNHVLALVNLGGTTTELLALAQEITQKVRQEFGIELAQEPELITS